MKHVADEFGDDPDGGSASAPEGIQAVGDVWLWHPPEASSATSWHFLIIKGEAADALKHRSGGRRSGFGSVKVTATIGATTWNTSAFPSKEIGGFLLPLKADVRKKESLRDGMTATVSLLLL